MSFIFDAYSPFNKKLFLFAFLCLCSCMIYDRIHTIFKILRVFDFMAYVMSLYNFNLCNF